MRGKGMNAKVKYAARIALPDEEALKEAGWDLEKTATPDPKDRSEKTLVEDGKKASDEPADVKVVADQREPVTSGTAKEAERTIRREEIIESDGPVAVKDEEEEEAPKEDEEKNETPHDPFGATSSTKVLTALKLAETELELGLDSQWESADKFARVAALESELSVEALQDRIQTLESVKVAGLSKPKQKTAGSLPRFAATKSDAKESSTESSVAPDSAIFS
jgi:hypothetical protein